MTIPLINELSGTYWELHWLTEDTAAPVKTVKGKFKRYGCLRTCSVVAAKKIVKKKEIGDKRRKQERNKTSYGEYANYLQEYPLKFGSRGKLHPCLSVQDLNIKNFKKINIRLFAILQYRIHRPYQDFCGP